MKSITTFDDFEIVKKQEYLEEFEISKKYSDLIRYIEIETWNRIGTNFTINFEKNKKNKVTETTLTENIVYLLSIISKELDLTEIELFEDWVERESGADLKLQLEMFGKYLEIPIQCKKIDFSSSKYKAFKHNVKVYEGNKVYKNLSKSQEIKPTGTINKNYIKCSQLELFREEINCNNNHVIGLYFFYNSLKTSEIKKIEISDKESHHFYGVSYSDINSLIELKQYNFATIHNKSKGYPLHCLFNLYDDKKNDFKEDENLDDITKDRNLNEFLKKIGYINEDVSHKDVLIENYSSDDNSTKEHMKRIFTIRIKNNIYDLNKKASLLNKKTISISKKQVEKKELVTV